MHQDLNLHFPFGRGFPTVNMLQIESAQDAIKDP